MSSAMDDVFGHRPHRPDTKQFWELSEMILQFDGRMEATPDSEKDKVFQEVVGQYVGLEELSYMAIQRAMRSVGAQSRTELMANMQEVMHLSSCWMEAFVMGCEWATRKDDPKERSM